MSKLSIGDKVITTGCVNGFYEKDWVGKIVDFDDTKFPYFVEFEDGQTFWVSSDHVELYNEPQKGITTQTLLEQLLPILEQSLKNGFKISDVRIKFETGLVISVGGEE